MGDNTYDNGDELELNCLSEGGPDLEYSWSRMMNDFSATTTTNTNTLTISNLTTVDGGEYTCTVNNSAGTDNQTITVYGEFAVCKLNTFILLLCLYCGFNKLTTFCIAKILPQLFVEL